MIGYFGEDWSSPELWKDQVNPAPSPLLDTDTVYPSNFVELPHQEVQMPSSAPEKLPRWLLIGGAAVIGAAAAIVFFGKGSGGVDDRS